MYHCLAGHETDESMAEKSAAHEALEKVESRLECGICLQTYNSPRVLPCFHVFCSECLQKTAEKCEEKNLLSCPNCRRDVALPAEGVDGLQSAFHINHLFEIRDTLVKAGDAQETKCEKCEEEIATGYCRDCSEFVCDDCIKMHKRWKKKFGDHNIVEMKEVEREASNLVPPQKVLLQCPKHPEETLKIFCETCQQLACFYCTLRDHRDHQHDTVSAVFTQQKETIEQKLEPLKGYVDTLTAAQKAFDQRKEEIAAKTMEIEAQIQKRIETLCQLLLQRKAELFSQLGKLTQQKLKSLTAQREELELRRAQLLNCIDYVEGSLKTGSQEEVLAHKTSTLKQLHCLEADLKALTMEPQEKASQVLAMENLEHVCRGLGVVRDKEVCPEKCEIMGDEVGKAEEGKECVVKLKTVDCRGHPTQYNTAIEGELVHQTDHSIVKCTVTQAEKASYSIAYVPQKTGMHQLKVTIGQKQINGSPFTVYVVDRVCPEKCEVIGDGMEHAVEGDESQVDLKTVDNKGKEHATNVNIEACLINNKDDSITKCKILPLENGKYRISYIPKNRGLHQLNVKVEGNNIRGSPFNVVVVPALTHFNQPVLEATFHDLQHAWGLAINSKQHLIVAESKANCIAIMTMEGKKIQSLGSSGTQNQQFNNPSGVAIDNNDNIYIADANNHRIQKYGKNGQCIASVGGYGTGQLQFNHPYGITYNKRDGLIYVCDTDNHRLQVLTTELQYSHCIGSKGAGNGKFNRIFCVAFDNKGQMYVADGNNKCLQVLNPNGEYLYAIGETILQRPMAVIVDATGRVYVADYNACQVYIFKGKGEPIESFQANANPIALTIDSHGYVFVSLYGSSSVLKY